MAIDAALRSWNSDPAVDMVLIDGAGEKAFCAGGDIQELYRSGQSGDFDYGRRFWSDEYRMNARLANFPKPYVALMDGYVMGGGVGVSAHGSHRIVTERTRLAMPECAIGLIPDVGGSWCLAHAPGHIGDYVGLTGARLGAADAIYAGLADGFVHSSDLPSLRQALIDAADPAVLAEFWDEPGEGRLAGLRQRIDAAFGYPTLAETVDRLETEEGEWAADRRAHAARGLPDLARLRIRDHSCRAPGDAHRGCSQQWSTALSAAAWSTATSSKGCARRSSTRTAARAGSRPAWRTSPPRPSRSCCRRQKAATSTFKHDGRKAMKIGFIGLGNMGAPMAANLVKAGHEVTGYDVAGVTVEGVAKAASAAEAARDKDAVITMLPNGEIVRAVYDEIVPAGRPGACFIECSTVDVESARAAHEKAKAAGLLSVDAPVSGGVGGATAGTLTFMAGGSEDAFAAARPLFDVMGAKAVHCGGPGAGQSAKICNNMILGISMIGVCEAIALADKLGLDRQRLFDVVSTSSGSCWSMNTYCPAPGVGPDEPRRQRLQAGICRRTDAEGPDAQPAGRRTRRCANAARRACHGTLPRVRRRQWQGEGLFGDAAAPHGAEAKTLTGRRETAGAEVAPAPACRACPDDHCMT